MSQKVRNVLIALSVAVCLAAVYIFSPPQSTEIARPQSTDKARPQSTDKDDIVVGLVAAQSGPFALAGESIQRGLEVAIDEVNDGGGLLSGRKLRLVVRNDEGNPSKGTAAARELIEHQKAAVVFGGPHSPVSLAMLPVFHELTTPYMGVFAAATKIIQNDQQPNYMFRVSACDDLVDSSLTNYCVTTLSKSTPGLILENTPWGESNEFGLRKHMQARSARLAGVEKFNVGDTDMTAQLLRLREAKADCLVMIANAPDGAQILRGLAKIDWDVPVISHWGVGGGRFPELAGDRAGLVKFVQTYSFFGKPSPMGERVIERMKKKYNIKGPEDITVPVAVANSYDALHILAKAITMAGSTKGPEVRDSLEKVESHQGLIKFYRRPFTPEKHDALDAGDYIMVSWVSGKIVPISSGADKK